MLAVRKKPPGFFPQKSLFHQASKAVLETEVGAGPQMAPSRICKRDCKKEHPPSFAAQLRGRSAFLWGQRSFLLLSRKNMWPALNRTAFLSLVDFWVSTAE